MARQVARRLTRFYEAELGCVGMNPAQFELLGNLHAGGGVSQTTLARRMDVDQTTLSRNLRVLVGRGWVSTVVSDDDRRRVEYGLSEPGRAALEVAVPHWERATERVRLGLGGEAESVWGVMERLGAAGL